MLQFAMVQQRANYYFLKNKTVFLINSVFFISAACHWIEHFMVSV